MTWDKVRRSLGYQADMAKAARDERDACASLAKEAIKRGPDGGRGKEFADGYLSAAEEIYTAIAGRGVTRFTGTREELLQMYCRVIQGEA